MRVQAQARDGAARVRPVSARPRAVRQPRGAVPALHDVFARVSCARHSARHGDQGRACTTDACAAASSITTDADTNTDASTAASATTTTTNTTAESAKDKDKYKGAVGAQLLGRVRVLLFEAV